MEIPSQIVRVVGSRQCALVYMFRLVSVFLVVLLVCVDVDAGNHCVLVYMFLVGVSVPGGVVGGDNLSVWLQLVLKAV